MRPLCLLVALLTGCAVGPDYVRPDAAVPAAFPGASAKGAPLRADWWKSFRDPELDRLVEAAFRANADLRAAVARVEQAGAQFEEVEAATYPQLNATGSDVGSRISQGSFLPINSNFTRSRRSYRAGLSTAFELDFWGRVRRSEEAARAQLLATEDAAESVRLTLAASVVRAYAALRAADESAAASDELVAVRTEEAGLVKRRVAVGSAGPAEVAAAEEALASAVAARADVRRRRAQAESLIGFLSGTPALTLPPRASPLRAPAVPAAGLPAAVLARRPDVRAAEQALVAATAQVGLQVASRLPTFNLTGAFGTESRELSEMFGGPTQTRSLGVDFAFPLLDWGGGAARVAAAEAGVKAAAAEYERAAFQALREVRDALADVREAGAAAASADRVESASRESFRLARVRAETGQGGPAELLDARRRLAESRLVVARLRFERAAAHADFCRAIGGADPAPAGR